MLQLENLHKTFTTGKGAKRTHLEVLRGVGLTIADGEVISVLGPSGAGKSTMLRCVNFLERPDSGIISLNDKRIDTLTITKHDILYLRRNTGMVFQNYNLFQNKTAIGNVMEGLLLRGLSKPQAQDRARAALDKVGMLDRADEFPSRLSGGQQQRIGIARALALEPSILLLDEPTSALDNELVGEVLKVIRSLAKEHMTMLIVTHEIPFAREISDRAAFFDNGVILECSAPETLFTSPSHERTQRFLERYIEQRSHVEYSI
ncbi:arginine ABC transporter ATP-binding protein [Clostridia bacterium]|nr:arginine ABC transporter ATP-binding protein [Clostridia bacterium]